MRLAAALILLAITLGAAAVYVLSPKPGAPESPPDQAERAEQPQTGSNAVDDPLSKGRPIPPQSERIARVAEETSLPSVESVVARLKVGNPKSASYMDYLIHILELGDDDVAFRDAVYDVLREIIANPDEEYRVYAIVEGLLRYGDPELVAYELVDFCEELSETYLPEARADGWYNSSREVSLLGMAATWPLTAQSFLSGTKQAIPKEAREDYVLALSTMDLTYDIDGAGLFIPRVLGASAEHSEYKDLAIDQVMLLATWADEAVTFQDSALVNLGRLATPAQLLDLGVEVNPDEQEVRQLIRQDALLSALANSANRHPDADRERFIPLHRAVLLGWRRTKVANDFRNQHLIRLLYQKEPAPEVVSILKELMEIEGDEIPPSTRKLIDRLNEKLGVSE